MILLDYQDRRPLYEQVEEKLKELIYRGVLTEHSQLPSVRSLAMELSINPNTIQRAYAELERKQMIYSIKGKGSFVSPSQTIQEKKAIELEGKLILLVREARNMDISQESLIELVRKNYNKEGSRDDRGSGPDKTI